MDPTAARAPAWHACGAMAFSQDFLQEISVPLFSALASLLPAPGAVVCCLLG